MNGVVNLLLLRLNEEALLVSFEEVCKNLLTLQTLTIEGFVNKQTDPMVLNFERMLDLLPSLKDLIDEIVKPLAELGLATLASQIHELSLLIGQLTQDVTFLVKVITKMTTHHAGHDLVVYEAAAVYTLIDYYRVIQEQVKQKLETLSK